MVLKLDCSRTRAELERKLLQKSRQKRMVTWTRIIMAEVVTTNHILDMF